jgi:nucleoid-associated protein YgaU
VDYENDFRIPYRIEVQPAALLTASGATNQQQTPTASITTAATSVSSQVASAEQDAATPTALADPSSTPASYVIPTTFGAAANTPVGTIANRMSPAGPSPVLSTISQITHLVAAGESLWAIATRHYGNGNLWPAIAAANGISNPMGIVAGQRLIIPNAKVQ